MDSLYDRVRYSRTKRKAIAIIHYIVSSIPICHVMLSKQISIELVTNQDTNILNSNLLLMVNLIISIVLCHMYRDYMKKHFTGHGFIMSQASSLL